ncbi:MAG TPA: AMP-binding protein, partial [Ktedonobacteraceae bacterium]|nr:AMP-binding protein [Ktedonobacteraceae bacterium]
NLQESPQGLTGYLEYSTDLFDASFAAALTRHFAAILKAMVASLQQHIANLAYLSLTERQQLLHTGTGTAQHCPSEKGLAHLFEIQVAQSPEALAVICENERLTYAELNRRANRLAHYLREAGVGAEILVALLLERGWKLLTAILAVFKVGGAYLPLDPQYPPARLSAILEHSQSRFVLTTHDLLATLDAAQHDESVAPQARVWCIEDILSQSRSEENLAITVAGEHLVYVIYTSGSTGRPKGVMIEQRGMINHLYSKVADLALSSADIVAQTASQCFDISVWQFLSPLIVGACVQIFPNTITHDPALLFQQVDQQDVTILETVPSLLEIVLEGMARHAGSHPLLGSLRWLLLTGEALPPGLTRSWFQRYPTVPVLNAYGPTECSDDIATAVIPTPLANTVIHTPIGGPIINTRLYVLSPAWELLPTGVPGELYAGGSCVGRG